VRAYALAGPRARAVTKAALDLSMVALGVVAAYVVRFERIPSEVFLAQMGLLVVALPPLRLGIARLVGVHRASWRLFGLPEAIVLARTVAGVSALLLLARLVHPRIDPAATSIPLSVIALEGFLSLAVMTAARVAVRLANERAERLDRRGREPRRIQRALLVGAGRAGRAAARELRQCPDAGYTPIGFLDDSPERLGQEIEHVRVLGGTADAVEVARRTGADALILTMPSVSAGDVRRVVERCRETRLPMRTVPSMQELLRGEADVTAIRPLCIEDLLGREVFALDDLALARVRAAVVGKCVLVTGAGGSIGSELCRQLVKLDPGLLVLVEGCENNLFEIDAELRPTLGRRLASCLVDVRSVRDVFATFDRHRPHIVFHAAAFKHVPMMEAHPSRAVENNVGGTRIVAEAARRFRAHRFVLVSTDKAVNPSSVMGATKRAGELLVLAQDAATETAFLVVRFGNVLGSKGSVIHTFARQIAAGGPVTVTDPDVTRFFMTTAEAVRLVLQAAVIGRGGEVFLLDMGEPIRIVELARHMIDLAGPNADGVRIEFVGLRPGEKPSEELVCAGESPTTSGVPGLQVVRGEPPALAAVERWIVELQRAAGRNDDDAVLALLAARTGYLPDGRRSTVRADNATSGGDQDDRASSSSSAAS
jgi:FlaA1/EpsC-like NDP-sugar epimerase